MMFTKYDKLGDYHWRAYELNCPYREHADAVASWVKEKSVVDIGCGDGLITHLIGGVGIDNNEKAIELAKKHRVNAILSNAEKLPFKDEEFESAIMIDVLEHTENPTEALKEARRVITWFLYVTTPVKGKTKDKFHIQEWGVGELKDFVESAGFVLVDHKVVKKFNTQYAKFKKT